MTLRSVTLIGILLLLLAVLASADEVHYTVLVPQDQASIQFRDWAPVYTEERIETPGEAVEFPFSEIVYFDFNSCELQAEYSDVLANIAEMLGGSKTLATLGGHTDVRGEVDVNYRYGQCRIDAVIVVLEGFGIDTQRLNGTSYGELDLVVSDAESEEEHAANRRVTIDFTVLTTSDPTVEVVQRRGARPWQRRDYLGIWRD